MALSNRDRVGRALDVLRQGLQPFVERELQAKYGKYWVTPVTQTWRNELTWNTDDEPNLDAHALLKMMWDQWNDVFRTTLGHTERSIVSELRTTRNDWAHQKAFTLDDTYRALDSIQRLLNAVSAADEATQIDREKQEVLRLRYESQAKQEVRKAVVAPVEGQPIGGLRPWREIITPHPDVAGGNYQQAEFAADLAQVHRGEGSDEYRDPQAFFQRTFLTEGLRLLLTTALRRLSNNGGDPVVELQTNFGGGKTHSMLALYHLFSGVAPTNLVGIEPVLTEAQVITLPTVRRAVLVGTALSPATPHTKDDGTITHTMWGEMAWQLGGAQAYKIIAADDKAGTSPGSDRLVELFKKVGPALILIDEWVAYVRQLYTKSDLPAGSFEANLTFAQSLTEAAKAVPRVLLVASLPSSDIEIGGEAGRDALARLRNTFSRVESPWRAASAEESFEIVRRRLFQPISDPDLFKARDAVIKRFVQFYGDHAGEFPAGCREVSYEQRMRAAYPIHPELFDRLYNDWGSLEKFQRTRGVLRLMAAVIHALWDGDDRNLLILPATVPIHDSIVQSELTRYLDDNWRPVIEKDVDGPHATPVRLDNENPNLGRYSAARRVARTIYLGSAPTAKMTNKGVTDQHIKLGTTQPGESVATFGDALRRLTDQTTYLYLDGQRYWYDTQPSVNRLAQDRAAQQTADDVQTEILRRLKDEQRHRGEFGAVYIAAASSDIPDERDTRLVILGPQHPHVARTSDSPARQQVEQIFNQRGNSHRTYRNTLVFLAPDRARLGELENAVRQHLAWCSIATEQQSLDLNPSQVQQVETKRKSADDVVVQRMPETYVWLLVPEQQPTPSDVQWQESRVQGNERLALRTGRKLINDGAMVPVLGPAILRREMDRIPLWRDQHVGVRQLLDYFAQYLYLPRLKNSDVLLDTIRRGVADPNWHQETFAYAEGWDAARQRYLGLQAGTPPHIAVDGSSLLVHPDAALAQRAAEVTAQSTAVAPEYAATDTLPDTARDENGPYSAPVVGAPAVNQRPRRFFGTVELPPATMSSVAKTIADEIVQHLVSLHGADVRITLEIHATMPEGADEQLVRTVTENSHTLKFSHHEFGAE